MNLDWVGAGMGIALAAAGSRWLVRWIAVRQGYRPEAVREPARVRRSGHVLRDLAAIQRSMEPERRALSNYDDRRADGQSLAAGLALGFGVALVAFLAWMDDGERVSAFSLAPAAVLLVFAVPDAGLALASPDRRASLRVPRALFRLGLGVGFLAIGMLAGPIPEQIGGIGRGGW